MVCLDKANERNECVLDAVSHTKHISECRNMTGKGKTYLNFNDLHEKALEDGINIQGKK